MKSMINAIIYHGENVLVLELPRNIYDIHEKLMSIGCPIAPGRIPLTDNKDDALRVKLFGRIEMGNHLIRMLSEENTLADANTLAFAVLNALQQAISGKEWTGWKLVEGRSNRKYTSEAAVATTVEGAGFDPYERKVLGVTAMQKMLGKTRFEELLAPYIEKPQGKPTLVPESDKRPAMNTAKNDFMEEF